MKLEIKNLSKTYGNGIRALRDVSLTIEPGMFGLLGQNGAGKSTLMRTVATLQTSDTGSVHFGEIDVAAEPQRLRQVLGYLPQEFGVYPAVSAEEMLLHLANFKGIASSKERKEQVAYLLEKVNLYPVKKQRLGTFSGGMKQRFGIAQALLGNPQLIIVDEPTAGLDPTERNRFYNLLSEIGENIVVILSTHIVEDVRTLCSDMAIIGEGEVLLSGEPRSIETGLAGQCWRKEIARNELEKHQADYFVISSHFSLGQLNITVIGDDRPGEGFVPKTPTLEDAYFKILAERRKAQLAAA